MLVRELMNKTVEVINCDKSVFEAAEMMAKGNYGAIPVERNDKMVGMITDRDICIRVVAGKKSPESTKVSECMTEGISYCFDDEDISTIGRKMMNSQIHRLPVVNREKKLVGIVSTRELVTAHNKDLTQDTFEQILDA